MSSALQHSVLPQETESVSVLIVDDESGTRETLVDIFEAMGYRADTAENGQEALEKAAQRDYNIALLDVRLPDMSGTDLLARLKSLDRVRQADTVCIIATGYASMQTSIDALNQGAYAYVTKPLDLAQINTIFRQALDKQRLERENRRLLRELTALSGLTDTALTTLELDGILQRLLTSVTSYMEADAGAILLLDDANQLRLRCAIGIPQEPDSGAGGGGTGGFVASVAQERKPLVMHGRDLWHQDDSVDFRARGIQSALGVPLESRGQLIGVAHVDSITPREYTSEEIRLLQVLADRAGVVIDNARLFARERELAEQAKVLAEEALTLRDVAEALVASVSLSERLETLARNFVRATGAERCVMMLREGDELIPQALYGVPRRLQQFVLSRNLNLEETGPTLRRILVEGWPRAVSDVEAEAVLPPEMARRWKVQCVLLVPLQYGGRVVGVVGLDNPGRSREFTEAQIKMARALAHQATVAIETGKTYEAERNVARTLQESFLSRETRVPSFDVASRYEPASAVAQIGGDYFDFISLGNDRLGIVMGDVCGKGLTAAVYTAMAKYMLRAYAMEDATPASVATRLNRALYSQMSEECMFITILYGVLQRDTGSFTYANAAHPPPLLYRPGEDTFTELSTTGGMVGAVLEMEYSQATVQLNKGDVLTLFTDGVTEARTSGEMLESEGVQEVIRSTAHLPAQRMADAIYNRAVDASSGELKDDVAIVVIKAGDPGE